MKYICKTPILLISYKRAQYLKKVLESIKKINPNKIYIYSDGPKNMDDEKKVNKCRSIINKINWCSIEKKFNKKNLGIEQVPKNAIDWVFADNNKAIILEDDTIPSKDFFLFCEKLLKKYENNNEVSMISGTNLATNYKKKIDNSYFFSKYSNIWGWATWKNRWFTYDKKMKKWPKFKKKLKSISYSKKEFTWWNKMFELAYAQKSKNWDYQWTFENFYRKRYSVVSTKNLVSNIGVFDASGKNSKNSLKIPLGKLDKTFKHPKEIKVDIELDNYICKNTYITPPLTYRIKNKFFKYYDYLDLT